MYSSHPYICFHPFVCVSENYLQFPQWYRKMLLIKVAWVRKYLKNLDVINGCTLEYNIPCTQYEKCCSVSRLRDLTYLLTFQDHKLVETITQRFNNELVFDPELNLMCYTLRDPVSAGTFPTAVEKKPRGKARRVEIKSRCFDACLVIDGSLSYKFNDGTRAIVSIHDEDVLRTVHIYSSDI